MVLKNNLPDNRTALMVFSLSASLEAKRKPVFGTHQRKNTTRFFQLLIDDTHQIAQESGLDVVWMDEEKQRGNDFASRFTQAYQDLFDQGYEHVISIGNDCPELQIAHLQSAVKKLQQNKVVLGPANDGGIYLLGISKKTFDNPTFRAFSWQQAHLCQEIETWGNQANLPIFSFGLLSDLDTLQDVIRFSAENPYGLLGIFIIHVLNDSSNIFNPQCIEGTAQNQQIKTPPRAPPYAFQF